MAKTKKDFLKGIDALITPTVPPKKVPQKATKPETKVVVRKEKKEKESEKAILLRMPVSLKIKMQHYCIDNQIPVQKFIISAIEKFLDKK